MAEEGRTEKATRRQRDKAREKGDIAKSRELGTFFNLFAIFIILSYFGDWLVRKIIDLENHAFSMLKDDVGARTYGARIASETVQILYPIMLIALSLMAVNYIVQVRYVFAWKAIIPDFKKINPMNGFKSMFARRTFVDIVKQLLTVSVLGYIVYGVFSKEIPRIVGAVELPWTQSFLLLWGIFKSVMIKILAAVFVLAVLDFLYQKWEYEEKLKMKKEDVKRENKEDQGSPEVKGKQREMMIAILKNEVMSKIKDVTFVAVNPTHYAVAVRYKRGEGNPKVMFKGIDHMAIYIKETAKKFNIPIVENAPLARELYQRVVDNESIPEDMWTVVAAVLRKLVEENKSKID